MLTSTQSSGSASSLYDSINASNSSLSKKGATDANSVNGIQDRFLKLLITQMKNQDPLNPMDNAQVTSQMAQLSTVSGIEKLNTTLQALSSSMVATQSLNATSMIGRSVLVPGARMDLVNGRAIGGLELAQDADKVMVAIKDASGTVVRTMDLGAQTAGVLPLVWDGKTDSGASAPSGTYQLSAQAKVSGNAASVVTLAFGAVNAVTQGAQGVNLEVGGLGGFALTNIKQIL